MILFLLICSGTSVPFITDTGIFHNLSPQFFAVAGDGTVFIGDREDRRILSFDDRGRRMRVLGEEGALFGSRNEPGQLFSLAGIFHEGGKLFAIDYRTARITTFTAQGQFVDWKSLPREAFGLLQLPHRTQGGWVYSVRNTLWLAEDGEEPRPIVEGEPRSHLPTNYNPAPDYLRFDVSPNGFLVYFYLPGEGFTIRIYDTRSDREVGRIQIPHKPVPFDRSWGNERLERARQRLGARGKTLEPDFPEFFPVLANMEVDYHGHLRLHPGHAYKNSRIKPVVVDQSGVEVESKLPIEQSAYNRILAVGPQWVYRWFSAEDGEVVITREQR